MTISTRNARRIRAGINSKCIPYLYHGHPDSGYFTSLDFVGLRQLEIEWSRYARDPLAIRARNRTQPWTRERVDERYGYSIDRELYPDFER